MALIKAKARQTTSVERVSEGADTFLKALRDGSLAVADLFATLSLEGRAYQIDVGTFTAPVTFTAGAIVATTPDIAITVPDGTTIIPVEISVQIEAIGTALILEIVATTGVGGSVTTAGTTYTPRNLRTDNPRGSSCTVSALAITAVAPVTNPLEFWRDGEISAVAQTHSATVSVYDHAHKYSWSAQNSGTFPVIVGPSHLFTYISTQAGSGFWKVRWVELPSSSIT